MVRRREILVQDGVFDKKRTLGVVAALAALAGLERLNSLPSVLFSCDTSEPWGNFMGSTAVGFLTVIIGALFVLGVMCFALTRYVALLPSKGMPRPPSRFSSWSVSRGAGPCERLIVAVAAGLLIATAASLSPPTDNDLDAGRIVAGLVLLAAASFAIYSWGALNAWSWIVAALVYQGLDALRNAVYSPTWQEHGAGALGVVVVMVLIAAIARRTRALVPAATSS